MFERSSAFLALIGLLNGAAANAAPGRVISASPIASEAPRSNGWKILYESTDSDGRAIPVGGVVYVPEGQPPAGGWPVVAWAHGSWGLEPKCNYSQAPSFWTQSPFFKTLLARGYAVVATDYAGFAEGQGMHPYLVGDVSAHAVLDAVRAAARVRGAGTGRSFVVWGESQGAHAALWTASLAQGYAPGLSHLGTIASAPPTRLADNLGGKTDPTVRAFLTAFAAASWEKYYGADLRTITGPVGADLIRRIAKNCVSTKGFKFTTQIGILRLRGFLKGVDLGNVAPWNDLMGRNDAPAQPGEAPLLIVQGGKDVVVAPDVTKAYARGLCRRGRALNWLWFPAMEHQDSAKGAAVQGVRWIEDRFAGRTPGNDCGKV